jgi:hypothetical protein
VVQNTFVKIRQESREAASGIYDSTIAYREWCFFRGSLTAAITLTSCEHEMIQRLERVIAHVSQIGKRGCFWQFRNINRHTGQLPSGFTRTEALCRKGRIRSHQ